MIDTDYGRRRALALIGAGAALLSFPTWARGAAVPPGGLETVPEAQFAPDDASAVLTALEDMRRRMIAPVLIDGKGPFNFMVDTGTNRSIISNELAAMLALPPGRPARVHGIAGESIVPTARIASFAVGARKASNLVMATLPEGYMEAPGILGVDGLKDQRLTLNLQAGSLQIVRSGSGPSAKGALIRARRRFGQLTVVDTDLAGGRVAVMVDTGAETTVGNTALRNLVKARRGSLGFQDAVIEGVTGEKMVGQSGLVPEFRLGALVIRNLRIVYADLHPFALFDLTRQPAMLMGMDVLRFFEEVELDFGKSEVRLLLPATPFIDPAGDPRRS